MIKLKNEVFNNIEFLETVKKIYREELPVKDSYRLLKVLKELNERLAEYDELKSKILQETGFEEDENTWKFETDEKFKKFQEQFNDLLSIEINLNFDRIKCPDTLKLSPFEMEMMEDILDYGDFDG